MKRFLVSLAMLCLFLGAFAQDSAIDKRTNKKSGNHAGIRIGQPVPDLLVTRVTGLKLKGKKVAAFHLADFRGKLLIIDFWATWCAPCRKMVPVMDSLQKIFKENIQFLPVTYESEKVAAPVLAALQKIKPFDLPEVTGDIALNKLFPHRSLPHYVWISAAGTLLAITEEKEVTAANISKFLAGRATNLAAKRDSVTLYNAAKPLLIAGNGGDPTGLQYHSLLTSYKAGLAGGISVSRYDSLSGQHFTARNAPFPWLCRLAFGENGRVFPRSRLLILTRDSLQMDTRLAGQDYEDWLASGKGWCYELQLPPALSTSAYPMMQQDLARLFPAYRVSTEQRKLTCLALVRTSAIDKLKTKGEPLSVSISPYSAELRNAHLSQLMMRLERQYLQNSTLPVVDATGYAGRVDLFLTAQLYNVEDLNKALAAYDLRFEKREQTVEVLVIRDNPIYSNLPPKPKS